MGLALTEMSPTVQDLLPSTGAVVILDGEVTRVGLTPAVEEILEISSWLVGRDSSGVFFTDNLRDAIDLESIACGGGGPAFGIDRQERAGPDRVVPSGAGARSGIGRATRPSPWRRGRMGCG